ncbi:MAG: hypothetical protein CMJ18_14430 [Phycisphaeraceae bacterium]|nr:hypothetical protein [Phycisphaeraceae bacterium]
MRDLPRIARAFACGLALSLLATSSARTWHPYSERYSAWQKDRPLTFGAWHDSNPTDHLADRVARFRAAGFNNFLSSTSGSKAARAICSSGPAAGRGRCNDLPCDALRARVSV